jgi:ribonuclease HI
MPMYVPPPAPTRSFEASKVAGNFSKFDLYLGCLIECSSNVGAFGWVLGDVARDELLSQNAITLVESPWTIEQLEYKALIAGLKEVQSKGIKSLKVHICSDLVISHLLTDQMPEIWDITKYQEMDPFKAEVLVLFNFFEQITFEKNTTGKAELVVNILKKSVSDCIKKENASSNLRENMTSSIASNQGQVHSYFPTPISSKPVPLDTSHQSSLWSPSPFQYSQQLQKQPMSEFEDSSFLQDMLRDDSGSMVGMNSAFSANNPSNTLVKTAASAGIVHSYENMPSVSFPSFMTPATATDELPPGLQQQSMLSLQSQLDQLSFH